MTTYDDIVSLFYRVYGSDDDSGFRLISADNTSIAFELYGDFRRIVSADFQATFDMLQAILNRLQDEAIRYFDAIYPDFMLNDWDDYGFFFIGDGYCHSVDASEYRHYARLYRTSFAPACLEH